MSSKYNPQKIEKKWPRTSAKHATGQAGRMGKYNPRRIERKWQAVWEKQKLYQAKFPSKKKKYYALIEFPYPSGDGLHVGHVRSYTAMDIVARKRRMEGYNVLYPIVSDAFGLPTENYAIKTKTYPKVVTKKNTDNFRRQLKLLGFSFDWDREINTTDPVYYKWTQWLFLKFFEQGLAYKAKTEINWCPKDKIGLANEEVIGGACERCGTAVEKREKEQWMLRITAYAEKLLEGLKEVDYIPQAKLQQENWIGRSEGAVIQFPLKLNARNYAERTRKDAEKDSYVEVFTTRPDTIFGATFLVLGPEHEFVASLLKVKSQKSKVKNIEEIGKYIAVAKAKTKEERVDEKGEKTGVQLHGIMAVNPATGQEISVWVADYVLGDVGTGAIMAVPAHDERDFAFAKKYWLDIVPVVVPSKANGDTANHITERLRGFVAEEVYTGRGTLMHSGAFNGMDSEEAKWKIVKKLGGEKKIQYRLRDWVFSRQRYWGEPIPLIFCMECKKSVEMQNFGVPPKRDDYSKGELMNLGWIPVPEKDLPVELPDVASYIPTDTGESPLANMEDWVRVKCPRCGGEARRETDVMPNWAGSSWYFLRYADPHNKKEFAAKKKLEHFMPVDWYNGGMEHTVLHLLYSRFWNQFLYDIGLVPSSEPYIKRTSHGLILGEGGIKMSKSKGNVVNPDELISQFGADALRLYEMFIGPFNQHASWDPHGIVGMRRFLERVWNISAKCKVQSAKLQSKNIKLETLLHKTIKKVSEDIENLRMNTAVSALMVLLNEMEADAEEISNEVIKIFLRLLAPFTPHIAEELWHSLGEKKSIHVYSWPQYDEEKIKEDMFQLVIQVNGKVRATMEAAAGISKEEAEQLALAHERVIKALDGKKPEKVIYVAGRLVNIVV